MPLAITLTQEEADNLPTISLISPKANNLAGVINGRLHIIRPVGKRAADGAILWLCTCICGNSVVIDSSRCKSTTKSCGCIHKEKSRIRGKNFGARVIKQIQLTLK
jgi:hypothetical protein